MRRALRLVLASLLACAPAPSDRAVTLGRFTPATPFVRARFDQGTVVSNGFLFVVGGFTARPPLGFLPDLRDVQVAPSNADGSLGAFTATINADGSLGAFRSTAARPGQRSGLSAVVAEGHLFALGGYDTRVNQEFSDILVAPVTGP